MALVRSFAFALALTLCFSALTGCVSHRLYNQEPDQYILTLTAEAASTESTESAGAIEYDLAIIEFDDHGTFWKRDQLEAAVALIELRNAESPGGVLVIPFVHGWKNNADPEDPDGDLARFRRQLANIAASQVGDDEKPDRVVGVFFGWRGATSRVWLQEQLTFWDRRRTAERLVSLSMREAMFRIMSTARQNPRSKCFVVGHSMGGMIVGKTLAPSLTTLLLAGGEEGVLMPADLVVLLNPALDALASWQFVDLLKRSGARLELRDNDGGARPAPGPIIVSITSESDRATGTAYPLGRTVSSLMTAFRGDHEDPQPSQRYLATRAEGHVDALISHRAWVGDDGEVVLERVPDAWNDTPFWIIRVSREISDGHSDLNNPRLAILIDRLTRMNDVYAAGVDTWMMTGDASTADER
ncbi:MAG: hypothetical protein ACFCBV_07190 [Phycisphaerales bacterium]